MQGQLYLFTKSSVSGLLDFELFVSGSAAEKMPHKNTFECKSTAVLN
jgi:hypothetical protein